MRVLFARPKWPASQRNPDKKLHEGILIMAMLLIFCFLLISWDDADDLWREQRQAQVEMYGTLRDVEYRDPYKGTPHLNIWIQPTGASSQTGVRLYDFAYSGKLNRLKLELDRLEGKQAAIIYREEEQGWPYMLEIRSGGVCYLEKEETLRLMHEHRMSEIRISAIMILFCLLVLFPIGLGMVRVQTKSGGIYPDDWKDL